MAIPLGIQNPLRPAATLGWGRYRPNLQFLTPLGSQPLTVLNPRLFQGSHVSSKSDVLAPSSDFPLMQDALRKEAVSNINEPASEYSERLQSSVSESTSSLIEPVHEIQKRSIEKVSSKQSIENQFTNQSISKPRHKADTKPQIKISEPLNIQRRLELSSIAFQDTQAFTDKFLGVENAFVENEISLQGHSSSQEDSYIKTNTLSKNLLSESSSAVNASAENISAEKENATDYSEEHHPHGEAQLDTETIPSPTESTESEPVQIENSAIQPSIAQRKELPLSAMSNSVSSASAMSPVPFTESHRNETKKLTPSQDAIAEPDEALTSQPSFQSELPQQTSLEVKDAEPKVVVTRSEDFQQLARPTQKSIEQKSTEPKGIEQKRSELKSTDQSSSSLQARSSPIIENSKSELDTDFGSVDRDYGLNQLHPFIEEELSDIDERQRIESILPDKPTIDSGITIAVRHDNLQPLTVESSESTTPRIAPEEKPNETFSNDVESLLPTMQALPEPISTSDKVTNSSSSLIAPNLPSVLKTIGILNPLGPKSFAKPPSLLNTPASIVKSSNHFPHVAHAGSAPNITPAHADRISRKTISPISEELLPETMMKTPLVSSTAVIAPSWKNITELAALSLNNMTVPKHTVPATTTAPITDNRSPSTSSPAPQQSSNHKSVHPRPVSPPLTSQSFPNLHPLQAKPDISQLSKTASAEATDTKPLTSQTTMPQAAVPSSESETSKTTVSASDIEKLTNHIYRQVRQRLRLSQERHGLYSRRLG